MCPLCCRRRLATVCAGSFCHVSPCQHRQVTQCRENVLLTHNTAAAVTAAATFGCAAGVCRRWRATVCAGSSLATSTHPAAAGHDPSGTLQLSSSRRDAAADNIVSRIVAPPSSFVGSWPAAHCAHLLGPGGVNNWLWTTTCCCTVGMRSSAFYAHACAYL